MVAPSFVSSRLKFSGRHRMSSVGTITLGPCMTAVRVPVNAAWPGRWKSFFEFSTTCPLVSVTLNRVPRFRIEKTVNERPAAGANPEGGFSYGREGAGTRRKSFFEFSTNAPLASVTLNGVPRFRIEKTVTERPARGGQSRRRVFLWARGRRTRDGKVFSSFPPTHPCQRDA